MTWLEIKKAADAAGVRDDETINAVTCEDGPGDKSLHRVTIGTIVRLVEGTSADRGDAAFGCAS